MPLLLNLTGALIAFLVVFLTFYVRRLNYWSRKNVPQLEPKFPWGHISSMFRKNRLPVGLDVKNYYKTMKSRGHAFAGFNVFVDNFFLPIDLELIKDILSKSFNHFTDRTHFTNEKDDPLSGNLLMLQGERWRKVRARLTPTFTSGKLKLMVESVVDCGKPLVTKVNELHDAKEPLDIRELMSRFTTDIIGRCAFGLECNSIVDPDAEFRKFGKKVVSPNLIRGLKNLFGRMFPSLSKKLGVTMFPKEISDFYLGVVKTTINYRKENNVRRNDFLQLLIDMMDTNEENENQMKLTFEQVCAHSFIFFLAGFETSSTTLTYSFFELAQNQDIQDKVRKEIIQVLAKNNNRITYESLKEMKYLNQVINETLRKYPPAPLLARKCTQDYTIPGTDVVIEKNKKVFVSIYGLHHDPDYFPEPEKFDPERFSDENKGNIVPYTFIPFGEGPRICIGLRFSYLETQIGLITILRKFKVFLNEKTPKELTMLPSSILLINRETVYLDVEQL